MKGGLKIEGDSERVGHILIARPDKREAAQARLARMGIDDLWLPAIEPSAAVEGTYVRFDGGTIQHTPAQQGAALSHIAALSMGRAYQWEWVGLWEEDVEGVPSLGAREFSLPADCGVVYLGGILWGKARDYGHEVDSPGQGVWRVAQPWPISCTHAVMIHASAMDDVIASCARMDMTADDCVSRACIDATKRGSWSTCFVQPWLAWQVDRRETWPNELIKGEREETKQNE